MVVGAAKAQYDYATVSYWHLYETTNFTDPASVAIITKVPNQPTNFNSVAPIYGTDDHIIFASGIHLTRLRPPASSTERRATNLPWRRRRPRIACLRLSSTLVYL